MRSFIHVTRHTGGRDADVLQRRVRLRTPRRTGLAIARERLHSEDASHIRRAAAFAPRELCHAIEQSALGEILGGRGMHGVKIRVVADVVLFQRRDHIVPSPRFEHTCFLAHDFECGADAAFQKHVREPQTGVVIRRQQIILRVEPEDHVNLRRGTLRGGVKVRKNRAM